MCARFDEWNAEIKKYCAENNLDYDKARRMAQCWNDDMLVLQYADPSKGKKGLLDETPAPAVLMVFRQDNGVRFEQTEHTKKFLAQ